MKKRKVQREEDFRECLFNKQGKEKDDRNA